MSASVVVNFSLNAAISSFEAAVETDPQAVDLADFLPHTDHAEYFDTLVELVRVDIEFRWNRGFPNSLDSYLFRFPVLKAHSELLQAVCFEEHRQKIQAGQPSRAISYQRAYGVEIEGWADSQSGKSLSLDQSSRKQIVFDGLPSVGDKFLGFELISELGCGSFARVFLARQADLSDRAVALKVTRNRYSDSKTLARLQHTNIIPVYSVQRQGDWEAICMPFFGAMTVGHLLATIREQPSLPPSGKLLFDTIATAAKRTLRDHKGDSSAILSESGGVNVVAGQTAAGVFHELTAMSYPQSILLLAKKIASGLAYAHSRGVIHRDIKPANILLADDGEPMLLDFNLSESCVDGEEDRPALIGGTIPYMAPEQLADFQDQTRTPLDSRSDVFSLGIIIYELLTGSSPYPVRYGVLKDVIDRSLDDRLKGPAPILNPAGGVSPAVKSILSKCLAADSKDRYQSAQQLAEDLECQLESLPLRHAPDRSVRERCQKWLRRHPRWVSSFGITVAAGLLLLGMLSLLAVRNERIARFESQSAWLTFQERVRDAEVQMTGTSVGETRILDQTLAACDAALKVFQIDEASDCKSSAAVGRLTAEQRDELARDAAELFFLKATTLGLKAGAVSEPVQRNRILAAALKSNKIAGECCPDSGFAKSLEQQSRWLRHESLSVEIALTPSEIEVATVRTLCTQACLLSAQHRFQEATTLWQIASMRAPQDLWVWHGLAYSLEQIGEFSRAAESYSVCISINPEYFGWFFSRGNMRLKCDEFALARTDFTKAIELNSEHAESYVNLALALMELREFEGARDAVGKSIALGFKEPQAYLLLSRIHSQLGDTDQADAAQANADACVPERAESWIARGVSRASTDPEQAIRDFDSALRLNSNSLAALESKASVLSEILYRTQEAVAVLNEAVRLFPESGEMRAVRGVLYARLDQKVQAVEDAERALSLDQSPAAMYRVAGIYALLANGSDAYGQKATQFLATALISGYGADLLDLDPDLTPIRELPEFKRLRDAFCVLELMSTE